jgi:hypothetical protein
MKVVYGLDSSRLSGQTSKHNKGIAKKSSPCSLACSFLGGVKEEES